MSDIFEDIVDRALKRARDEREKMRADREKMENELLETEKKIKSELKEQAKHASNVDTLLKHAHTLRTKIADVTPVATGYDRRNEYTKDDLHLPNVPTSSFRSTRHYETEDDLVRRLEDLRQSPSRPASTSRTLHAEHFVKPEYYTLPNSSYSTFDRDRVKALAKTRARNFESVPWRDEARAAQQQRHLEHLMSFRCKNLSEEEELEKVKRVSLAMASECADNYHTKQSQREWCCEDDCQESAGRILPCGCKMCITCVGRRIYWGSRMCRCGEPFNVDTV